jgi:hypothetical protein
MTKKANTRTCPRCPHRLADFHTHETTPELTQYPSDDEILPRVESTPQSIISLPEEETSSKTEADERSSTENVSWLGTALGQAHMTICPAADICPFRIHLAKQSSTTKDPEATETKTQGEKIDHKHASHVGKAHLSVCPATSGVSGESSTTKRADLAVPMAALESGHLCIDQEAGTFTVKQPGGSIQEPYDISDLIYNSNGESAREVFEEEEFGDDITKAAGPIE